MIARQFVVHNGNVKSPVALSDDVKTAGGKIQLVPSESNSNHGDTLDNVGVVEVDGVKSADDVVIDFVCLSSYKGAGYEGNMHCRQQLSMS